MNYCKQTLQNLTLIFTINSSQNMTYQETGAYCKGGVLAYISNHRLNKRHHCASTYTSRSSSKEI